MLVSTNDAFVGVNSLALWSDGLPTRETIPLVAWDAGTEDNAPLFSGFELGQPDPTMGMLNVENSVPPIDGAVALHDQFSGVQGWLTITPLESTIRIGSGLSLIGWTGVATTSTVLLAANPDIDILWFWDGTAWRSDTTLLPDSLPSEVAINFGDAMFVVTSGATEVAVPLAKRPFGPTDPARPQLRSPRRGLPPRQPKNAPP